MSIAQCQLNQQRNIRTMYLLAQQSQLTVKQIDQIYVVSINEAFNISVSIVDFQTLLPIENIL